ncbi:MULTISPECIES: LytTR family DNA-binding domain-containing protein [unclassified Spirosoma]|uniref:LytR/AlgR family response regulator transcription factor n=1 Tax=unclassified Spirosoma TaxID=2621999 RepID=UPI000963AD80|nr:MULTISPECIES: LytTR family DNA-binding domain-containing protein [unclassified Spirosoma]MBN8826589.1 response regulator transcription factor [Spirosoma sp.]OJW72838.1 MAG: DNA-binding response regulator [Spirosoma sp. 48-14]
MKKIRCLLVDDEPLALALLQKHLSQLDFMEVAGTCSNAVNALEHLNRQTIDLMFLDIRLPAISGVDFLKTLRHPPKTILTTAYREYALEGYELDIIDYLLKPITFDRFFKAIERYFRSTSQLTAPSTEDVMPFIFIKSAHKYMKINTVDILYIESLKDYIKIQTREKEIIAKYKISDLENELTAKGFLRIHRSYIVNLKNITAFTATDIEVDAFELPIGESYKAYLFKLLNKIS